MGKSLFKSKGIFTHTKTLYRIKILKSSSFEEKSQTLTAEVKSSHACHKFGS